MNTWKEEIDQQADRYLQLGAVGEMIKTIVDLADRNEQVTNVEFKTDLWYTDIGLRIVYGDTIIYVGYVIGYTGYVKEYSDNGVNRYSFEKPHEAYGIVRDILS